MANAAEYVQDMPVKVLKESLLNLAWDCQSGWLNSPSDAGVEEWDDERVRAVASNIIDSLWSMEGREEDE